MFTFRGGFTRNHCDQAFGLPSALNQCLAKGQQLCSMKICCHHTVQVFAIPLQCKLQSAQPWYNLSRQGVQPLFQERTVVRLSLEHGSEPEGRLLMSLTVVQASVVLGEACDGGCIMSFEGVHSDLYAACGNDCQLLLALQAEGLKDTSVLAEAQISMWHFCGREAFCLNDNGHPPLQYSF